MMGVTWFNPGGGEQQAEHWTDAGATTIGVRLSRDDLKEVEGAWPELLILFNPHDGEVPFKLPERESADWRIELDTAGTEREQGTVRPGDELKLMARSLVLLA